MRRRRSSKPKPEVIGFYTEGRGKKHKHIPLTAYYTKGSIAPSVPEPTSKPRKRIRRTGILGRISDNTVRVKLDSKNGREVTIYPDSKGYSKLHRTDIYGKVE